MKKLIMRAFYINVDGLSRKQAEEQLYQLMIDYHSDTLSDEIKENYIIEDVWFPVTSPFSTKVEVIYPNKFEVEDLDLENIDKMIVHLEEIKRKKKEELIVNGLNDIKEKSQDKWYFTNLSSFKWNEDCEKVKFYFTKLPSFRWDEELEKITDSEINTKMYKCSDLLINDDSTLNNFIRENENKIVVFMINDEDGSIFHHNIYGDKIVRCSVITSNKT